jgi:hypothetical protein
VLDQLGSAGTYYPWGEDKGNTNPQDAWVTRRISAIRAKIGLHQQSLLLQCLWTVHAPRLGWIQRGEPGQEIKETAKAEP